MAGSRGFSIVFGANQRQIFLSPRQFRLAFKLSELSRLNVLLHVSIRRSHNRAENVTKYTAKTRSDQHSDAEPHNGETSLRTSKRAAASLTHNAVAIRANKHSAAVFCSLNDFGHKSANGHSGERAQGP
jgi:TPP-dependent indolepyruvate ferredoxin oxidoreductase alpha subunit